MKLISWNCNQAFRKKYDEILQLDPEVIVVPECENPARTGNWSIFSDWAWIGEDENQGLGIFTRNGITIDSTTETHDECRYALPVTLDNGLRLIGIWAKNDKQNPENRYIARVYNTIRQYSEWIDANTIVAGDFNWNATFGNSKPLAGDFSDTIQLLHENQLRSIYHTRTESDFGNEDDPTFFMHKKEDRPYHIDYVFIPTSMTDAIAAFSIGSFDEWIHASDHMPLTLEIE